MKILRSSVLIATLLGGTSKADDENLSSKMLHTLLRVIESHSNDTVYTKARREIALSLHQIARETVFQNNSTSFKALQWLSFDDNLTEGKTHTELLQRFVLSVLYFSTNGDKWRKCSQNDSSECAVGTGIFVLTRFIFLAIGKYLK